MGVVVCVLGNALVGNANLAQILGHLVGGFHIGQHTVIAGHAAYAALHIAECDFQIVLDACALLVVIERNPDTTARQGRGSAKQLCLFDHQGLEPLFLRANRAQQRTCAGTYDDQVIFLFCHTLSPEYLFYWMDCRKSTYAAATASFDCRRYFSIRADQTKGSWLGMPSTCEP